MSDINSRILQIADYYGVSKPSEFAKILDVSHQNATNYLKGMRVPKVESIEKIILKFDKVNPVWLLTGKGKMLISDDVYNVITDKVKEDHADDKEDVRGKVKYYDIDASASPIEMFDPGNGTHYKDLIIPGFGDCEIALNVWGDSMEPALSKGEIILCKEWKEQFVEFGYIYLVVTKNNHRMIKYLQPGDSNETVMCVSKNEFYKPFEIKREDILKLFVVKGHIERSAI